MSNDEMFALMFSLAVIGFDGGSRVQVWFRLSNFVPNRHSTVGWIVVAVACLGFLHWLLATWAAHDVTDSTLYRSFYLVLGAAWIIVSLHVLPWLGLSFRDDVLERKNHAAACAIYGAAAGTAVIYGLANTGDGPGWWCVVVAALLGQLTFFAGWAVVLVLTELHEQITVDRDLGAGMRGGAWLLAAGIVLGRAAAGTWTSLEATIGEFFAVAVYFPTLVGVAVFYEIIIRRIHRWQPDPIPVVSGIIGAALYLGIAAFILTRVGPWS